MFSLAITLFLRKDGVPPSFGMKVLIGLCAGAVGAFVGTPADLTLIRMTTDGRLPPAERRNYSNALVALVRIAREEGILALWKGAVPTMGRAMVVNAVQLSTYQQAKQQLLSTGMHPSLLIILHHSSDLCHDLSLLSHGMSTNTTYPFKNACL